MSTLHLLYRDSYEINDSIRIVVPTVGQVLDNEDTYYNIVSAITDMPIDFMVQLDDLGIDFTTINAWQLFVLLFENLKQMDKYDLSLVFGDLDLSCFEIGISPQNGKFIIRDEKHDITIDRAIHSQMASVLRKLHHLEKNHRRPANDEAKEYMLRRAREKLKRHKDRKENSQLDGIFRYQDVACCPEHGSIYLAEIEASRAEDANQIVPNKKPAESSLNYSDLDECDGEDSWFEDDFDEEDTE